MDVRGVVRTGRGMIGDTLLDAVFVEDATAVSDGEGGVSVTYVRRPGTYRARFVRLFDDVPESVAHSVFGVASVVVLMAVEPDPDVEEGDVLVSVDYGTRWLVTRKTMPDSVLAVARRYGAREVG